MSVENEEWKGSNVTYDKSFQAWKSLSCTTRRT